jgi:hypothetical protein
MGCCDPNKGLEEGSAVFKDPRKRWCTDIICLLLFIVAWGAAIATSVVTINKDTSLLEGLMYPTDSYGNNCGKGDLKDLPVVIYPKLDQDIQDQYATLAAGMYYKFTPTKICAPECPSTFHLADPYVYGQSASFNYPGFNGSYYYTQATQDVLKRCFPLRDSEGVGARTLCAAPSCNSYEAGIFNTTTYPGSINCATVDSKPSAGQTWEVCPPYISSVADPSGAGCIAQKKLCNFLVTESRTDQFDPFGSTADSRMYTDKLANYVSYSIGAVSGLLISEALICQIVMGIVMPIVMGFAWAAFLWLFAAPLVFALILSLIALFVAMTAFLCYKAGWFGDLSSLVTINVNVTSNLLSTASSQEQVWYGIGAVVSGILMLLLILFFFMARKAIMRLIAIIKECTKVFKTMALIVLWPLIQVPLQLCILVFTFFMYWYTAFVWEDMYTVVLLVIAWTGFGLWNLQFFRATTWTSMAGAISKWYVEQKKAEPGCCTFGLGGENLRAMTCMVVTKHLGSMAFGALVIAICQLIRVVLQAFDYYTKDLQKSNFLLKMVVKCSQCVMWCLQKTIEFVSYYGFIFVALEGKGFCEACYITFKFILANPVQTSVNKLVQAMLQILIKWTTCIGCSLVTFYWLDAMGSYSEYNAMWAALVVFVLSYVIASGVVLVYGCAIDTIYIAAFKDMADNPPNGKFMSDDLKAGFGLDQATAEREGSKRAAKYESVGQRKGAIDIKGGSSTTEGEARDGGGNSNV